MAVPRLADLCGATGTQPDDRKVDEAGSVAELVLDQLAHGVELLSWHRSVVGTTLAGEVLPLTAHGQRVQPRAVAEMNVANHADVLERLQVSIHRADVRRRHAATDPFGDLLG